MKTFFGVFVWSGDCDIPAGHWTVSDLISGSIVCHRGQSWVQMKLSVPLIFYYLETDMEWARAVCLEFCTEQPCCSMHLCGWKCCVSLQPLWSLWALSLSVYKNKLLSGFLSWVVFVFLLIPVFCDVIALHVCLLSLQCFSSIRTKQAVILCGVLWALGSVIGALCEKYPGIGWVWSLVMAVCLLLIGWLVWEAWACCWLAGFQRLGLLLTGWFSERQGYCWLTDYKSITKAIVIQ